MLETQRLEDVPSGKPQGRGASAAASSGTTHMAGQGEQAQHCLNTETDTALGQGQGRSALSTLAEYPATGVCMKRKKERKIQSPRSAGTSTPRGWQNTGRWL